MASICTQTTNSGDVRQLRWVGDPVDVVTGTLAETVVDVTLAADPPIRWRRHYSSALVGQEGPFGRGGGLGIARSLRITVDGILYTRPCSQDLIFPYPRTGQAYLLQRGHRLEFSPVGLSTVARPEGGVDGFMPNPKEPGSSRLAWITGGTGRLGFFYDERGRVVRIAAGDTQALNIEWQGERVERLWTLPASGAKAQDLLRYAYDEHQRLREILDHYGARQIFRYDDAHQLIERSDRCGYRFEYAYDDEGRCISARGHDGVAAVKLRYMPEAQATLVTQADGGEWLYRYDESESIIEIIDPLGGKRSFSYHADGRLDTETDASGEIRSALYDRSGEIIGWRNAGGALRPATSPSGPLPHRVPRTVCELEVGRYAARVTSQAPYASASIRSLFLNGGSIWSRLFATRDPRGEHLCHRDLTGLLLREHAQDSDRPAVARVWGYTANGWVDRYRDHDGGNYKFEHRSWNH
ncbi:MAG TPA: RHS repeat protein, partial [Nannocystis exedens]|nr:RHS repeat protein [Nannocystis exedens]